MGGGTRLKVLQAMAMGKAIVSTSLGAEGIGAADGREIVLRDEPDAFADAVVALLTDGDRRRLLGRAARGFVKERFDWRVIAPGLARAYRR
jgi:glycosyltransferase involved in cell wall biosynthesis